MSFTTMLDVAKKKGNLKEIGMIEEIGLSAPEVTALHTVAGSPTTFKVPVRDGVAKPKFRPANAPAGFVASTYKQRNVELFPLSALAFVDNVVLQSADEAEQTILSDEANGVAQGALLSVGAQTFYGQRLDKNGFPGLPDYIDDTMLMSANAAKQDTEEGTSVYLVCSGPKGVQYRYGRDRILSLGAFRDMSIQAKDPETGEVGMISGKGADLLTFVALVCLSELTQARLKNLDADHPLTDDLLADLIYKFPAGIKPTHFIMNRQSAAQLRKSRQVVAASVNGAKVSGGSITSAPMPTEAHGIPIIITDSIVNNEADLSQIKTMSHWGVKAGKKPANAKNK